MTLEAKVHLPLDHFDLDVELSCEAGTITSIVGPSGSGKSTLLRIIAGLTRPARGRVVLGGRVLESTETRTFVPVRGRNLGYVVQDYALFPHLSLEKNVLFNVRDKALGLELMSQFGIMHLAGKRPHQVSGGERQRTALAQALARGPGLLLLDEPFSALDSVTRATLHEVLSQARKVAPIPILLVTHDLFEAHKLGDAVLPMRDGRLDPDWLSGVDLSYLTPPRRKDCPRAMAMARGEIVE